MQKNLYNILVSVALCLILGSCGEYQRVQKSEDYNYKFEYAKKAFEEKR